MINSSAGGLFLLLIILISLHALKGIFSLSGHDRAACSEKVFVRISGDIMHPGVYGFFGPPNREELLSRARELYPGIEKDGLAESILYNSGADILVKSREKGLDFIFKGEMSAFNKITLGIPVSINKETLEGLTAIGGIGPRTAAAIVRERTRRGGFYRMDELLSIPGIGDKLYKNINPYLTL